MCSVSLVKVSEGDGWLYDLTMPLIRSNYIVMACNLICRLLLFLPVCTPRDFSTEDNLGLVPASVVGSLAIA